MKLYIKADCQPGISGRRLHAVPDGTYQLPGSLPIQKAKITGTEIKLILFKILHIHNKKALERLSVRGFLFIQKNYT